MVARMTRVFSFLIVFAFMLFGASAAKNALPVVMWHGMGNYSFTIHLLFRFDDNFILNNSAGDTCCFSFSLGSFRDLLQELIGPDTYVKSIRIGDNVIEDFESGYFVHPNKQVEDVCQQIANDPKLQNGYNAIGFSQGSQFL